MRHTLPILTAPHRTIPHRAARRHTALRPAAPHRSAPLRIASRCAARICNAQWHHTAPHRRSLLHSTAVACVCMPMSTSISFSLHHPKQMIADGPTGQQDTAGSDSECSKHFKAKKISQQFSNWLWMAVASVCMQLYAHVYKHFLFATPS